MSTASFFSILLFPQVARPYSSAGDAVPVNGEQSKNVAKAFPSSRKTLHSCLPGELQLKNIGCAEEVLYADLTFCCDYIWRGFIGYLIQLLYNYADRAQSCTLRDCLVSPCLLAVLDHFFPALCAY